eukprot:4521057-Pleurochrysis_carterae.AAC.2
MAISSLRFTSLESTFHNSRHMHPRHPPCTLSPAFEINEIRASFSLLRCHLSIQTCRSRALLATGARRTSASRTAPSAPG